MLEMMLKFEDCRIHSRSEMNSEGPSVLMWTTPEEDIVKYSGFTSSCGPAADGVQRQQKRGIRKHGGQARMGTGKIANER